jgi:CRP-like cAMP-binding protein
MLQTRVRNLLLLRLTDQDSEALAPHLKPVHLSLKQELITPGEPISHVYFVESGIVSLIASAGDSGAIETALIGREGMTEQVLEVGDSSVLRCLVQLEGSALAIEASRYVSWIAERPAALRLVSRYLQSMAVQVSYTALSHGSFTIEERLSRWLLMCFDRSHGDDLPFVHEFMSYMLGVRRSGVTTALHVIEGHGAVKATRGQIKLRDRAMLESLTAGSYGIPEREYQRLLGPLNGNGH